MKTGRKWLVGCLCMAVMVSSMGCEPLRKKFTRQKKKGQTGKEIIPVLEPVDYPAKQYGTKEDYAKHYSLFRVWISDFDTNRRDASDKKLVYDLDAALNELGEMENILKNPKKEELATLKTQVQFVRDQYAQPEAFRNSARIDTEMRAINRAMKTFKPEALEF
jgi:hypothetical protein